MDIGPKFWVSKIQPDSTKHKRNQTGSNDKIPIYESQNGVDQALCRSMTRSLLFLTTRCLDVYYNGGVCVIYHVSLKVIYLLAAKVEYTAITRGCTHLLWMKNMLKDYDVLEEVLTHHYDNLKGDRYLHPRSGCY